MSSASENILEEHKLWSKNAWKIYDFYCLKFERIIFRGNISIDFLFPIWTFQDLTEYVNGMECCVLTIHFRTVWLWHWNPKRRMANLSPATSVYSICMGTSLWKTRNWKGLTNSKALLLLRFSDGNVSSKFKRAFFLVHLSQDDINF